MTKTLILKQQLLQPHHKCPIQAFGEECDRYIWHPTQLTLASSGSVVCACVLCGVTLTMTSTVTGTVLLRAGLPPSLAITLKWIIPLGTCS